MHLNELKNYFFENFGFLQERTSLGCALGKTTIGICLRARATLLRKLIMGCSLSTVTPNSFYIRAAILGEEDEGI